MLHMDNNLLSQGLGVFEIVQQITCYHIIDQPKRPLSTVHQNNIVAVVMRTYR